MKKAHCIAFFFVATLGVCFSFAYAEDTTSAGYQAKTAVADPGVGVSQSANYIYDHGTLWFDDVSVGVSVPPVAPPSTPAPTGGNGSGGSGGGGGGSGSGWFTGLFGGNANPQIGGVSPVADVPFVDTPVAATVVRGIPTAVRTAVKVADAPIAVDYALNNPQPVPQIIRLVDETGTTREIDIVLFKRIVPWPLWIAFIIILLGVIALAVFAASRGARERLLWIGSVLILIGIVTGIVIRFAYQSVPINKNVITSIGVVAVADATMTVKKLMADMPLGVHIVEVVDAVGKKMLTVKIFITSALPI